VGSPSKPEPTQPNRLHRPADVAKTLGCSEWWTKEQARKRRIPYTWIGGSYRFTDQHITEVIYLFEQRPDTEKPGAPAATRRRTQPTDAPRAVLHARTPRRALRSTRVA
jgi:hypothetical protein